MNNNNRRLQYPIMDRSSRQIQKETEDSKQYYRLNRLTDIYRTFHPTVAEYTFFTSAQDIF